MKRSNRIVLASRSPRRAELLRLAFPEKTIDIVPPLDPSESGFDGLHDLAAIEERLVEIARAKAADVWTRIEPDPNSRDAPIVIAADTTIVACDGEGKLLQVLGQPPLDDSWRNVVREWFRRYYRTPHLAITGLCIQAGLQQIEKTVRTRVTFRPDAERWLDWYLDTGESRGKAGGYAIQGAGSVFVERVEGSISNVIGLPLEAVLEAFAETDLLIAM